MSKKKKYNNSRKLNPSPMTFLLFLAGWIGFLYVTSNPKLLEFRSTLLYFYGSRVVFSGVIAYFALLHSSGKKLNPFGRWVMLLGCLIPWLSLLPMGSYLLAQIVLFGVQAVLLILAATVSRVKNGPLLVFMLSLVTLLSGAQAVTFVSNPGGVHFWKLGLILALLAGGTIGNMVFRGMIHLKDDRTSEKVCLTLIAAALGFVVGWVGGTNLNCGLDTSIPVTKTAVVVDSRYTTGKNSSYYLTLDAFDSQIEFEVAHDDYLSIGKGDHGTIERYEGAFGDPYYLLTELYPAG